MHSGRELQPSEGGLEIPLVVALMFYWSIALRVKDGETWSASQAKLFLSTFTYKFSGIESKLSRSGRTMVSESIQVSTIHHCGQS